MLHRSRDRCINFTADRLHFAQSLLPYSVQIDKTYTSRTYKISSIIQDNKPKTTREPIAPVSQRPLKQQFTTRDTVSVNDIPKLGLT
jgi:hypothetical protein